MNTRKILIRLALVAFFLCPLTLSASGERKAMSELVDAVQLFTQGEYKKSALLLNALLRQDPQNDAAYYYLSMCNMAEYKLGAAETLMQKALQLDSANFTYRYRLAQIYAISQKNEKALVEYEKLMAAKPKDRFLPDEAAEIYLRCGKYPSYYAIAKGYMSDEGLDEEAKLKYIGGLFKDLKKEELANMRPYLDSMFIALDAVHPDSKAPMTYWCQVLSYFKDWDGVERAAEKSLIRFPKDTTFQSYVTFSHYYQGEYDKAAESLLQEIEWCQGNTKKQLELYNWLGEVYFKAERKQKSYAVYEKALKLSPDYVPVLNNYAYFLSLSNKNLKKALEMSRKTVEAEPDNPTYLDTYGWILYLLGRLEEAREQFNHAKLYGGNDEAVILDHFATVLYDLGEYRLAFTYWEKALKKNTEGEVVGLEEKIAAKKAESQKKDVSRK